jgi:hypothetical protein
MWRRVDFVWTDISEERIVSIFRVDGGDTFLRNVGSHGATSQMMAFFMYVYGCGVDVYLLA